MARVILDLLADGAFLPPNTRDARFGGSAHIRYGGGHGIGTARSRIYAYESIVKRKKDHVDLKALPN
jgi:hypothetical protein